MDMSRLSGGENVREEVVEQRQEGLSLVPVVTKPKRGKLRKDGCLPGVNNQPGKEDWLVLVHTLPVAFETFEEYQRAKRYVLAFRFMLQRLLDLAGAGLRMGCHLSFTEDGDVKIQIDSKRSEQIMELITPGTASNPKVPYYSLKGEWDSMNAELAHQENHPFQFKNSFWDDARKQLQALLKTKDPARGDIPRSILHVNMQRALPEVKNGTMPIMGYESRMEFRPFWDVDEEDPDGLFDKLGFELFIDPKQPGQKERPKPLRLLCQGPFVRMNGKMALKEMDAASAHIFNHFLPLPRTKVRLKGKETEDGKKKVLYVPTSEVPEEDDGSVPLPWERLLGGERQRTIDACEQTPWIYVTGNLRMTRKEKFFFDVTYYRPPVSRNSKKDKRCAYVFIKSVPGENKCEGLHYQIHLMVEKTTKGKEKMDKWRSYSLPVNATVRKLESFRIRKNKLVNFRQAAASRHTVDSKKITKKLLELTDTRERAAEKDIRIMVRTLLRRLLPWACGNLRLVALPADKSPEELLGGKESFPWAFFEGALRHRCKKMGINYTGPSTEMEQHKARKAKAVEEILAKKLPEEERQAAIKACNEKFKADWQADVAFKSKLPEELSMAVIEAVKKLGKPKKEEEEDDGKVESGVSNPKKKDGRHRGSRAGVKGV